jgi:hypothetical protein
VASSAQALLRDLVRGASKRGEDVHHAQAAGGNVEGSAVSEQMAKIGVAVGVSGFGLTLADVSIIVTIFAGLAAAFASIAAGIYYVRRK